MIYHKNLNYSYLIFFKGHFYDKHELFKSSTVPRAPRMLNEVVEIRELSHSLNENMFKPLKFT